MLSDVKLAWVLLNGTSTRVSSFAGTPPELRPEVRCPHCSDPVVLKLGEVVAHHAAHFPGSSCSASESWETALHINAKFHLAEQLRKVTRVDLVQPCSSRQSVLCEGKRRVAWDVAWDEVLVEQTVGTLRPDLVLRREGQDVAAIEVLVTHAVDALKAQALAQLGLPWIEVRGSFLLPEDEPEDRSAWKPSAPLKTARQEPDPKWICEACAEDCIHVPQLRIDAFSACSCSVCATFRELEERGEVRIRLKAEEVMEGGYAIGEYRDDKSKTGWSSGIVADDPVKYVRSAAKHDATKLRLKREVLLAFFDAREQQT